MQISQIMVEPLADPTRTLGHVPPDIGLDLDVVEFEPAYLLDGLVVEVDLGGLVGGYLDVDDQGGDDVREDEEQVLLLFEFLVLHFQLVLDLLLGALGGHALDVGLALHQLDDGLLVLLNPGLDAGALVLVLLPDLECLQESLRITPPVPCHRVPRA